MRRLDRELGDLDDSVGRHVRVVVLAQLLGEELHVSLRRLVGLFGGEAVKPVLVHSVRESLTLVTKWGIDRRLREVRSMVKDHRRLPSVRRSAHIAQRYLPR